MKILLREHDGAAYTWVTAKYDKGKFVVNNNFVENRSVVSVINDNRKNYVQCSSCKKVFRKGDKRFAEHCENADKPKTCLGCIKVRAEDRLVTNRAFEINADGEYIEKSEAKVNLVCTSFGLWSYASITSEECLSKCPMRKCKTAHEEEIHDVFTDFPGVFDDLATVDNILDIGYKERYINSPYTAYLMSFTYDTWVYANDLGIIEYFTVYNRGDEYTVYYSKKYNKLYTWSRTKGTYVEFNPPEWSSDIVEQMCKDIRKLYK